MMNYYLRLSASLLLLGLSLTFYSQNQMARVEKLAVNGLLKIEWNAPHLINKDQKNIPVLTFRGSQFSDQNSLIPYLLLNNPSNGSEMTEPHLEIVETAVLSAEEEACIQKEKLSGSYEFVETEIRTCRKIHYTFSKLVPLRVNKQNGKIEKLITYRLQWKSSEKNTPPPQKNSSALFTSSSVLATGKWYKIATTENAVYKINKSFLQQMGINVGSIDPRNIQIYGNGGEMLSEYNNDLHYDDLQENAILVQGENDGSFDNNDYILFYGGSPHKWKYNPGNGITPRYYRNKHFYSDSAFYFLTVGNTPGKRIAMQSPPVGATTFTVSSFDDFQVHEVDATNIVKSGREFYGESFENTQQYSFNFTFPFLQNDTVWIKTSLVGRRLTGAYALFDVNYPGGTYPLFTSTTTAGFDSDVATEITGSGCTQFVYDGSTGNTIAVTVNRSYPDESGWMNYVWLVARRALTLVGAQMSFRDYRCIQTGAVSQFNLQCNSAATQVWDVTDLFNVNEVQSTFSSAICSFTAATDSLKEFIAFDGTNFKTPAYSAQVTNQDLHALQPVDYIIISHPLFLNEAQRLADLHASKEKYSSVIVTPDQIYNEFSSGAQDIGAIRQFVRMLYKRAGNANMPKYLLLLGGGSFNNKDRSLQNNTNFIPTYQTYSSASYVRSKTGDDFFGFLDDNEGVIGYTGIPDGLIDIGIGRIPVKSVSNAEAVVNKIVSYYERRAVPSSCYDGVSANSEDWRNWICLIADDANPTAPQEITFLNESENMAALVANNPQFNIDKIYEDSYLAVSVPGGRRYPEVVTAINNRLSKGALLVGYSGHGGELGLSHEEIITTNQILDWNNNHLPLFFTATCEFSRYDDPERISAGEYVLLNPKGGGIGLFTTTRLAFSGDGQALGEIFYPNACTKTSTGKYPSLGDIVRATKFARPSFINFSLLGDPALTLSYPRENISTTQINAHISAPNVNDTLSAMGKYTVKGFLSDTSGNKITAFNGTIYITIFDKAVKLSTLDNSHNGASCVKDFSVQKNPVYRGKSSVVNGDFQFTFIVPRDILYNYDAGKISYYAQADTMDAAGSYKQIIVGSSSNTISTDKDGPGIKLFMNNNQFVAGGITDENPYIYAELKDSSGINTTGTGLGHDIISTLDANTTHEYVLNDYYQADLDKYQSGKIKYQVTALKEGSHHLTIKAWDILNNSSSSSTDFVVAKSAEVALSHVLNYPNPFSNATKFFVEHNQACNYLDIEVQVFTITGRLVKTLQQTVHNEGYRTEGINWDGRDDFGDKLAKGVYIYKVIVKNESGSKADKIEKLVILN